jgi:hypothetical protein
MRNFLFALVVLFAGLGLQNASAAEANPKNWACTTNGVCADLYKSHIFVLGDVGFIPRRMALDTSAVAGGCGAYPTLGNGCANYTAIIWFPIGGGWISELKVSNIQLVGQGTACTINVGFQLVPYAPGVGVTQIATYTDNRVNFTPKTGDSDTYILNSGESVDIRFPTGSTPGVTSLGGIQLTYSTPTQTPACLQGIIFPQIRATYRGPNGVVTSNLTERIGEYGQTIVAPVSATAVLTATQGDDPAVAITNVTINPETVRVTLTDQTGKVVIATGTTALPDINLGLFASNAFTLRGLFGNAMFPGGKDFTGNVTVQVLSSSGGLVSVVPLSWINGSIGSIEPAVLQ